MNIDIRNQSYFSIRVVVTCFCWLAIFSSNLSFADMQKMKIVVSIEPLAIIVRDLVGAQAEVETLAVGAASPHHYALSPSQLQQLYDADLIVWIDPHFEFFMAKIMAKEGLKKNKVLQVSDFTDMSWPEMFEGENTGHHHEGHEEDHDFHFWLNPNNVKVLAKNVEQRLKQKTEKNRLPIVIDLESFNRDMDVLIIELNRSLSLIAGKEYAAFHDAYGHFAQVFNLKQAGFVAKVPDERISGKRLLELKSSVANASCLIADLSEVTEANKIGQKLNIPVVMVDILGVKIRDRDNTYNDYLRRLATQFVMCMN